MSAIDETREWSRHVVRWQAMVNNRKETTSFNTWYATMLAKLSALETSLEAQLDRVEDVQASLVEEGW